MKDNLLYLKTTPGNSLETILAFVVLTRKRQATIDGCYHCTGHQGRDHTISLMKESFWWPRMVQTVVLAVSNCGHCKQFESRPQIPVMQPIICMEPMELVHVDYVGMDIMVATQEKPVVRNVLVIVDHFTRHVQAHITYNQTAQTMAKVLCNEYFLVFRFPQ